MSCPNATAPIDINLSNISGSCVLKCDYAFKYNNSSCIATNRGNYVSLSYDNSSSSQVYYNTLAYNVKEIRLYTPSLHSYSGTKTDGELIIIHTSATAPKPLLVCIPVKKNDSSSFSASLFKTVVDTMSTNAPADGETTNVNIQNYNLNNIVPRKPYFSYSATEPYQPCIANVDYVVYAPINASIDISSDTLTTLTTIIQSNSYDVKSGVSFFFNEKGPGKYGVNGDDIYIDCQPVGVSDESEIVISNSMTSGADTPIDWVKNNPVIQIILGILVFIIIIYGLKTILSVFQPKKGGAPTGNVIL
jgi:carbonic anhydrase